MNNDNVPRVSRIIPDNSAPLGFRFEPEESPPDFTAEPHIRLSTRVSDLSPDDMWPALRERNQIRRCRFCNHKVWYDPKATVYEPTEIITCSVCIERVLKR